MEGKRLGELFVVDMIQEGRRSAISLPHIENRQKASQFSMHLLLPLVDPLRRSHMAHDNLMGVWVCVVLHFKEAYLIPDH